MSLTDWIISACTGLIAILIALVSYLAQKWVESLEKTIEKHSDSIESLTEQIGTLESKQDSQAADIAKTVQTELSAVKFPHSKIDEVKQEISGVKEIIQKKILPQLERQTEDFGKVIVVEAQLKEQNNKLLVLFKVLQRLVQMRSNS